MHVWIDGQVHLPDHVEATPCPFQTQPLLCKASEILEVDTHTVPCVQEAHAIDGLP